MRSGSTFYCLVLFLSLYLSHSLLDYVYIYIYDMGICTWEICIAAQIRLQLLSNLMEWGAVASVLARRRINESACATVQAWPHLAVQLDHARGGHQDETVPNWRCWGTNQRKNLLGWNSVQPPPPLPATAGGGIWKMPGLRGTRAELGLRFSLSGSAPGTGLDQLTSERFSCQINSERCAFNRGQAQTSVWLSVGFYGMENSGIFKTVSVVCCASTLPLKPFNPGPRVATQLCYYYSNYSSASPRGFWTFVPTPNVPAHVESASAPFIQ